MIAGDSWCHSNKDPRFVMSSSSCREYKRGPSNRGVWVFNEFWQRAKISKNVIAFSNTRYFAYILTIFLSMHCLRLPTDGSYSIFSLCLIDSHVWTLVTGETIKIYPHQAPYKSFHCWGVGNSCVLLLSLNKMFVAFFNRFHITGDWSLWHIHLRWYFNASF